MNGGFGAKIYAGGFALPSILGASLLLVTLGHCKNEAIEKEAEKEVENTAVIAGHLDSEQTKKMEALVKWEKEHGFVTDVKVRYNELASKFKAGQTYEMISKEAIEEVGKLMK